MRAKLRHPDGILVGIYGHDPVMGYFVQVRAGGKIYAEYDALAVGAETTLSGVLQVMVDYKFFSPDDVSAATKILDVADLEDIPEEDVGVHLAAEVLEKLKAAVAD